MKRWCKEIIKEELAEIQKNHKSERKTQIIAAEGEMNMEDLIANEQVIITISEDDYIKRMPIDTFREQRRGGQGVAGIQLKSEDDAIKGLYVASTHDYLLIFTNFGPLLLAQSVADSRKQAANPKENRSSTCWKICAPKKKLPPSCASPTLKRRACILMATRKGVVKKTAAQRIQQPAPQRDLGPRPR